MSRILIFAEAVTLAHIGRPVALARVLCTLGHDVCIAASPTGDRWLVDENVASLHIDSIAPQRFLRALARGVPPYDSGTLARYVEDDLRAIAAWSPDIVMGDFRLSLYISAKLARKPYGAIANAYWSRRYWMGVDAPLIAPLEWFPQPIANALFRAAYRPAFALHAQPFHRTCRRYGITTPGPDIRDVYTASDVTAFADVEAFYEATASDSGGPLFVGPLAWKPPGGTSLPPISEGPPIVFVSLGSSGAEDRLSRVLATLAHLPIRLIVATGGGRAVRAPRNCIHAATFVPYDDACAVASLVICNGGAPAVYAALAAATPVVGIAGNLDQLLNLRRMRRTGACHSSSSRLRGLDDEVMDAIGDPEIAASAARAQRAIGRLDPRVAVAGWLGRLATIGTASTAFTNRRAARSSIVCKSL